MSGRPLRVATSAGTRLASDDPLEIEPRATVAASTSHHVLIGCDRPAAGARPRRIEVVVDGWRFELELEDAARARLRERATRDDDRRAIGGAIDVRAIIPGRIVSVDVATGESVEAGGHLLVLEAMKMQNELRAPHAGTVVRIAVSAGITVERGDLLLIIEPHASGLPAATDGGATP